MNAYTRELLERESILLQSRQDARLDEPETAPQPYLVAAETVGESLPEKSRYAVMRIAKNNLWQLLQTPVPDLLFGRSTVRQFA